MGIVPFCFKGVVNFHNKRRNEQLIVITFNFCCAGVRFIWEHSSVFGSFNSYWQSKTVTLWAEDFLKVVTKYYNTRIRWCLNKSTFNEVTLSLTLPFHEMSYLKFRRERNMVSIRKDYACSTPPPPQNHQVCS